MSISKAPLLGPAVRTAPIQYDTLADFTAAGGATVYGAGPVWTGGKQYYCNGEILSPAITNASSVGRKKLLVFGNSLALQNMTTLLQGTNYSTISADARRGATSFTVSSASGASIGNKVAIQLYFGGVFYSTITNIVSNTITIADKLPASVKSAISCVVHWFTTDGVDDWVYQQNGPVYMACSMLGMPVDVIHGYGYGGALAQMLLTDLEQVLRLTRPDYVVFNLTENDIVNPVESTVAAEVARLTRLIYLACELSIASGATPIFLSNYPTGSVDTANKAAIWDAMKLVQINIGDIYPQAVGIDTSTLWLDTTTATTRPAIASWVYGGIHPVIMKCAVIGKLIKNALGAVIGSATSFKNRALQYVDMSGSGGSGIGGGFVTGGIVSTGITLAAYANLTTTATKTADDKQQIQFVNAAATTYGGHYVSLTTGTLPASEIALGGQWIKGVATMKVNTAANVNRAFLTLKFSPSNQQHLALKQNGGATGGWLSEDNYFDGETFVIETGSVQIPNNATGYTLELRIETDTQATVGAVVGDFVISEMGIVPGTVDIASQLA